MRLRNATIVNMRPASLHIPSFSSCLLLVRVSFLALIFLPFLTVAIFPWTSPLSIRCAEENRRESRQRFALSCTEIRSSFALFAYRRPLCNRDLHPGYIPDVLMVDTPSSASFLQRRRARGMRSARFAWLRGGTNLRWSAIFHSDRGYFFDGYVKFYVRYAYTWPIWILIIICMYVQS